jgi:hypothetical protein
MIGMADTLVLVISRDASANNLVVDALFETSFGRSYASGQHNLIVYHYIENGSVSLPGDWSHTGDRPTLEMVLHRRQQLLKMRTSLFSDTTEHLEVLLKGQILQDLREDARSGPEVKKMLDGKVASILETNTVLLMPLLVLHTSLLLNWRKVAQLEAKGHNVADLFGLCQGFSIFGLLDSHAMVAGAENVKGVKAAIDEAERSTSVLLNAEIAVGSRAQHLQKSILEANKSSKRKERSVLMVHFEPLKPILEQFKSTVMDLVDSFFDRNEVQEVFTLADTKVRKDRWPGWSKRFEACSMSKIREGLDLNQTVGVKGFNVPLFFFKGFRLDIEPLLYQVGEAAQKCSEELTDEFREILARLFSEGMTRSSDSGMAASLLRSITEFCASSVRQAMIQGLEWWKVSGSQQGSRRRLDENVVAKGWLPDIEKFVLREILLEGLDLQQSAAAIKAEMESRLPMVFVGVEDALRGKCAEELEGAINDTISRLFEGTTPTGKDR